MLKQHWKKIAIGLGFAGFVLTIVLSGGHSLFFNALALGGLMIYFWILEIIPIYVTALFPLIFAVPMGLSTADELAASYGNNVIFLFLGGFIVALALQKWEIHMQIARRILRIVGHSKPRIILGFLISTGFLSMWMSNTATALMMLPMAVAIIDSLPKDENNKRFSLLLLLTIAAAASIGGVGTLVGSPPNLIMAAILEKNFKIHVDFVGWLKIGMPLCLALLTAVYFLFYLLLGRERRDKVESFSMENEPWTANQKKVLAVFLLLVVLWSFKGLILKFTGFDYSDESAAILCASLLFLIPADKERKLLAWHDTEKLPWGILLLFGGGLALAEILAKGGIVDLISNSFHVFTSWPYILLIAMVVVISIFGSEVISNTAQVTVLIPIIGKFALDSDLPVIQLCFAVTMAASCAFMLPMGTPPNAIVFSSGKIRMHQMAGVGLIMNIISAVLITLFSVWLA